MVDDLIDVRADEGFDVEALDVWLSERQGLPDGRPQVLQFGGGKANLTYLLTFPGGEELVLRRPPLGPVAASSHDMAREYGVLSRLWSEFDKAPRALALCQDTSVIGAPFLIMERRNGVVVRGRVPDRYGGGSDHRSNRKLSSVVVDTLAEFHTVHPEACGLGDLGHPDGFLGRQVEGWRRRWSRAKHEEFPLADEIGGWLASNVPESKEVTLLHNDWRLDNMAVSPDDPGVCTAVYDWDMATRGDPLADLGTLMGSWFDPDEAPEKLRMMPTTADGWLSRDEAVRRYGRISGRDLRDVAWYLVFGSWKLGVILQQIYIRWSRGQTEDERFRDLDQGARILFQLAADRKP